jgi:S-adenosylmethionine:tRNA ribosyltransferase-isomerase
MRAADFDYVLPPERIAQRPAPERDESRLLVVHRESGLFEHRRFGELPGFLVPGDVLVLNNSRVIPARLRGVNERTGGRFEILLLEENGRNDWWALTRPGRRARIGTTVRVESPTGGETQIRGVVLEKNDEGHCRLRFAGADNIFECLAEIGEVPLPPYIERPAGESRADDRDRYQTVFAGPPGSVAAPTAGLHFTDALLTRVRGAGVEVCYVTLHVGYGTFAPVKSEMLSEHRMHEERFELPAATASAVNRAKAEGRRVIAAGTTSVRVLESVAARTGGRMEAGSGRSRLFIYPPYDFKIVTTLLTNFHLPRSTLLMLVSAFGSPGETRGRELLLRAYAEAIEGGYRFFSYGDAMLLL